MNHTLEDGSFVRSSDPLDIAGTSLRLIDGKPSGGLRNGRTFKSSWNHRERSGVCADRRQHRINRLEFRTLAQAATSAPACRPRSLQRCRVCTCQAQHAGSALRRNRIAFGQFYGGSELPGSEHPLPSESAGQCLDHLSTGAQLGSGPIDLPSLRDSGSAMRLAIEQRFLAEGR